MGRIANGAEAEDAMIVAAMTARKARKRGAEAAIVGTGAEAAIVIGIAADELHRFCCARC